MLNELFYKHLTLKNIIFIVVMLLLILFAFKNIDITMMFFVALVIACSLNPLVDKLEKKLSRHTAALIVLGAFVLLLVIFILPILYIGVYEVGYFVKALAKHINHIDDLVQTNTFLQNLAISQQSINTQIDSLASNAGAIFSGAIQFLQGLGAILLYILISIIFTYFFMADKVRIKNQVLKMFPKKTRAKTEEIIDIIAQKIGGYIVAQSYAILSVGVVMTVGLLLFRVDYAILLGLITAVLDIIPIVGPAFALVIALLATYQTGMLPVVGVCVSFAAAQLIENNFVRPYAFSKLLDIHPILVFTFLFIGAKYFGVIGALFAPAIAATVSVIIEEVYMKNIE